MELEVIDFTYVDTHSHCCYSLRMPLHKVPDDRRITPVQASKGYVAKLLTRPQPTVIKCRRIMNGALDKLQPSTKSKLTWTRMAAIAGHDSHFLTKHDLDWLWELAVKLYGDEHAQIGIGGILRWIIAGRDENWLLYVRDTGHEDPITGKKITISEYWIDDNYVPPRPLKMPATRVDVDRLKGAWGLML